MANPFSLEGKNAWITGASYGIGFNIAKAFVEAGVNMIVFNDINEAALQRGLENYKAAGIENVKGYVCDVTDEEGVKALVEKIHAEVGQIDILVYNAGITKDGLMMRMSEAQWDAVIAVNLKSAFNFIHACTPIMMRQRSGSIIAMSSVVGIAGNAGQANYAASKAGIIGLIKSLSKELGARNIRANAIAPGFILTDMTLALPEEVRQEMVKLVPMRRCGDAEEVAKVALFLASDLSSYVSGQVISVNGAMG